MMSRLLLSLLSALALSACTECNDLGCSDWISWRAMIPAPWTAEEVEAGVVRLCVNGGCEERPFYVAEGFGSVGEVVQESDGSASIDVAWSVRSDETALADDDVVSLTLLASDGTTIMGIAETAVTYELTVLKCNHGTCRHASFEGSTL